MLKGNKGGVLIFIILAFLLAGCTPDQATLTATVTSSKQTQGTPTKPANSNNGSAITTTTAGVGGAGDTASGKAGIVNLGMYPNAVMVNLTRQQEDSLSQAFGGNITNGKAMLFSTQDDPAKVIDFYSKQLTGQAYPSTSGAGQNITQGSLKGQVASFKCSVPSGINEAGNTVGGSSGSTLGRVTPNAGSQPGSGVVGGGTSGGGFAGSGPGSSSSGGSGGQTGSGGTTTDQGGRGGAVAGAPERGTAGASGAGTPGTTNGSGAVGSVDATPGTSATPGNGNAVSGSGGTSNSNTNSSLAGTTNNCVAVSAATGAGVGTSTPGTTAQAQASGITPAATVAGQTSPTPSTSFSSQVRVVALGPLDEAGISGLTTQLPDLSKSLKAGQSVVMVFLGALGT